VRTPAISVVVLTYEYPRALDAVLRALDDQSDDDFEVVADDGSGPETAEVVERWGRAFGERLRHVRQTHQEARVARVRNLGAASARGAYLAFLDGDCVPRRHLVGALRRASVSRWFAATYRFDLPRDLTGVVLDEQLPVQRWNAAGWARRLGRRGAGSLWWLTPRDRRRVGREREAELGPRLRVPVPRRPRTRERLRHALRGLGRGGPRLRDPTSPVGPSLRLARSPGGPLPPLAREPQGHPARTRRRSGTRSRATGSRRWPACASWSPSSARLSRARSGSARRARRASR